MLTFFKIMIK